LNTFAGSLLDRVNIPLLDLTRRYNRKSSTTLVFNKFHVKSKAYNTNPCMHNCGLLYDLLCNKSSTNRSSGVSASETTDINSSDRGSVKHATLITKTSKSSLRL